MKVWLLFCNDAVLGVFASQEDAENASRRYREDIHRRNWDWSQLPSGRWHCTQIARLEVDEWPVQC